MSIFFSYEEMSDEDSDIPEHQVEHLPDPDPEEEVSDINDEDLGDQIDMIDWGQDAIEQGMWWVPASPEYTPIWPHEEPNGPKKPICINERVE